MPPAETLLMLLCLLGALQGVLLGVAVASLAEGPRRANLLLSLILLSSASVLVVILLSHRVVPATWVERSTSEHVATPPPLQGDRWGYLWWVSPPESALGRAVGHTVFKATGGRGHKLVLVPELDLVVAHRLATGGVDLASQLRRRFFGAPSVRDGEFNELMRRIVAAHPERRPGVTAQGSDSSSVEPPQVPLTGSSTRKASQE